MKRKHTRCVFHRRRKAVGLHGQHDPEDQGAS